MREKKKKTGKSEEKKIAREKIWLVFLRIGKRQFCCTFIYLTCRLSKYLMIVRRAGCANSTNSKWSIEISLGHSKLRRRHPDTQTRRDGEINSRALGHSRSEKRGKLRGAFENERLAGRSSDCCRIVTAVYRLIFVAIAGFSPLLGNNSRGRMIRKSLPYVKVDEIIVYVYVSLLKNYFFFF